MQLHKNRLFIVGSAAAVLVTLGGVGGAVAGNMITSAQIQNQTIRSVDIGAGGVGSSELRNGSVNVQDLSQATKDYIASFAGKDGAPGGDNTNDMRTDWKANAGSTIVNATTVTLTKATSTTTGATSVEIGNLNVPVQANDVVSFEYTLDDGAACAAGAPRVFIELEGKFSNSWDQNIAAGTQCGTDPAGSVDGLVTFKAPTNGRIGQAGVVFDDGPAGAITVTNLTVDGQKVRFK